MVYFFKGVVRHYIKQMKNPNHYLSSQCMLCFICQYLNKHDNKWHAMLVKLSSWVTSNATLRVGSYNVTHHHMGFWRKNFVVVIFGVWIFGLLHLPCILNSSSCCQYLYLFTVFSTYVVSKLLLLTSDGVWLLIVVLIVVQF